MQVRSLGQEDLLEKEMAIHSSILAWEIPWREEPGKLQSMGWQRDGQNLMTKQQQQQPFVFQKLTGNTCFQTTVATIHWAPSVNEISY